MTRRIDVRPRIRRDELLFVILCLPRNGGFALSEFFFLK